MKQGDALYLQHIIDAIAQIEEYVKEIDEDAFNMNHLVQDGVIRQIIVIGEAVKLLSDDLRKKYDEVSWQDIAGMRDKLVHRYFGIDLEKVWDTVKEDLPALSEEVKKIQGEIEKK